MTGLAAIPLWCLSFHCFSSQEWGLEDWLKIPIACLWAVRCVCVCVHTHCVLTLLCRGLSQWCAGRRYLLYYLHGSRSSSWHLILIPLTYGFPLKADILSELQNYSILPLYATHITQNMYTGSAFYEFNSMWVPQPALRGQPVPSECSWWAPLVASEGYRLAHPADPDVHRFWRLEMEPLQMLRLECILLINKKMFTGQWTLPPNTGATKPQHMGWIWYS